MHRSFFGKPPGVFVFTSLTPLVRQVNSMPWEKLKVILAIKLSALKVLYG